MINFVAAQNIADENMRALSVLAVGALVFGLASLALTRRAAKFSRIPIVAALIGGGWMFFGVGLLLGPIGFHFLTSESLTELRPLLQLGLAWIGLLVGLQAKRAIMAEVPAVLWKWIAVDCVASVCTGVIITAVTLIWIAPEATWGALCFPCVLIGCATIGWTAELRSLRGLDARSPRLGTLTQAGAGLAVIIAITIHGIVSLNTSVLSDGTIALNLGWGSLGFIITLLVAGVCAMAMRLLLQRESWNDGRILVSLIGTLALIAGVATGVDGSPMFGACALGVMIANMRSGAMRKLERVITGSETAVASIFFLLAGAMVNPIVAWWPWIIAALVLAFRVVFKVPTTRMFSGNTWIERGADSIHFATIRQAPIAIPLAIASLLERTDNVQSTMLLVVATVGVFSNVIPLLWKRQS